MAADQLVVAGFPVDEQQIDIHQAIAEAERDPAAPSRPQDTPDGNA